MLTLNDGRNELWQWDTGRKLTVDADCSQVHFSNKVFGRSIDVDVVDGVAIIPDIFLQTDKELTAFAFVGTAENGYTKISKTFKVNRRNKPADYVFTPTEQTTLGELVERLDRIEESQDPDAIKNAVDDYLANNPIKVEETDPTVPEWAKKPNPPDVKIPDKLPNPHTLTFTGAVNASYDGSSAVEIKIPNPGGNGENGEDGFSPIATVTQTDTGAVISITDKDGTTTATITNGKDGKDGTDGQDGYTPQKGIDYFDGQPGKDGEDGKDGVDGQPGEKGDKGDKGDPGEPGQKGDKGDPGEKGEQGIHGEKGDKGEPGKDGADGVSATHSWNGTVLTITSASGTSYADLQGNPGKDGYTPVKGTDYWTDADQEAIVQQVITALGTPVFGRVDAENNIILTGELADGTYTIKYEDAEGNQTVIGTFDTSPGYTNMIPLSTEADGTPYNGGQGWKADTRLSSSGSESTSSATGMECTGFIPFKRGDVIRFSGITMNKNSSNAARCYFIQYDSNKAMVAQWIVSAFNSAITYGWVQTDSDGNITQINTGDFPLDEQYTFPENSAYFRISADEINDDSIITINQEID